MGQLDAQAQAKEEKEKEMKTLICQTNPTPGDFEGNYAQISDGIILGKHQDADLIVFPELSIPGYLCKDMMFRKGFVEDNLKFLSYICEHSKHSNAHIVVGYIDHNHSGYGKPFRNMAAVIRRGSIIATYQKHLLPFYDVFDEGRYFQHGTELTVININGEKWGICICEDLWNDKGSDDYNYNDNPVQRYRDIGVINIISINSSPYVQGKPIKRRNMVLKTTNVTEVICSENGTIVYCNQVGGQDELVFDGNSFVVKGGGISTYKRLGDHLFFDESWSSPPPELPKDDVYEMLKMGLKDYVRKSGFKNVVVGSSGGIDSALVISLACDALGPENVYGIRMPSTISSDHSKADAKQLHENLGCHDLLVPIEHDPFVKQILFNFNMGNPYPIANENIQARLRGLVLMYFSNAYGALLLSTGNKTELALGYCTLYGDMNGGFCPINDLYKMEVYKLSKAFNQLRAQFGKKGIPENILTKAPSAELAPGQTDEESLLPYPILDAIVKAYVEDYIADFKTFESVTSRFPMADVIAEWFKTADASKDYDKMIRKINNNEFKRRQAAPGIKVTPVAFGIGRRLPIVKGG
jgi:NAD+ synthetase